MTEQNPSAHARPASGRRPGGVEHENHPHHDHFTVVGNHLLQHPELSLTAIGLAVHIQSLPAGAPVGIKALAGKFPPPARCRRCRRYRCRCDRCRRYRCRRRPSRAGHGGRPGSGVEGRPVTGGRSAHPPARARLPVAADRAGRSPPRPVRDGLAGARCARDRRGADSDDRPAPGTDPPPGGLPGAPPHRRSPPAPAGATPAHSRPADSRPAHSGPSPDV
ncbi:hypothetical protein SAM23877_3297 [Streptomyces ambofaciens ATCC 23877]|uniref:Uncharacterized protein n=1 Tax=Streptomyces ambofaciens (strain ATCC 23877 / 3486 / DSM 40053 / JCM 4204 / NBRC 12836 / NRRL B-2516) TaxID=278992 RepID=A0A0K2ATL0_STRA7|nr:hypothetical protein SAM23877_3297 [Streptomyces ambofaciens ATCC 23877]